MIVIGMNSPMKLEIIEDYWRELAAYEAWERMTYGGVDVREAAAKGPTDRIYVWWFSASK